MSERFWRKVDRRGPDECWEWRGFRNEFGYGRTRHGRLDRGKQGAHRVAWALVNGTIPEGAHVLHRCDNPPCCNPAHLFLGTHTDNMRDMSEKGRARGFIGTQLRGELNPRTKLADARVTHLRSLRAQGRTLRSLAREFAVGLSTVRRALNLDPRRPRGALDPC